MARWDFEKDGFIPTKSVEAMKAHLQETYKRLGKKPGEPLWTEEDERAMFSEEEIMRALRGDQASQHRDG